MDIDYLLTYKCGKIVSIAWLACVLVFWVAYLVVAIPVWLVGFAMGKYE